MSGANGGPDAKLHALHGALCDEFARRLEEGEDHVTKGGEVVKVSASAATLRELRQFLSDNHIDGIPKGGSPVGKLLDKLPTNFKD